MFERLLIAVDGSPPSRRAARFGLELALAYDAAVEAVHVLEGSASDEQRERGTEILAAASDLGVDADVDVTTHLVEGDPSDGIVDRVAETGADLVVVGQQGQDGLGERLLGSVAERVLRRSEVPVLVVPDADPVESDVAAVERVLATTDGSDAAEEAAPVAADVAARVGATLHVLGVVDVEAAGGVFDAGGVTDEYVDRLREQVEGHVESFATAARDAAGAAVVEAVVRGTTHTAIGEYVTDEDVDLVVMGSRRESSLTGHLLGSLTDRVLRLVDVPVLVVPSD